MSDVSVLDNPEHSRYELHINGNVAVLEYRRLGDKLIALNHTGVPETIEGRGVAAALAKHALDDARKKGVLVLPFCPYVAVFIRRHPDYMEVVSPRFKGFEVSSGP